MGKVCNEASEMSHHPHKPSDGGIRIWFWEVLLASLYPIFRDMMCEVGDFISEQITFGGFELQMLCSKPVKDNPHVMQMIILILGEGNNIIEVDQTVGEIQLT